MKQRTKQLLLQPFFCFLVSHLYRLVFSQVSVTFYLVVQVYFFAIFVFATTNLLRLIVLWGSPNSELQPRTGPALLTWDQRSLTPAPAPLCDRKRIRETDTVWVIPIFQSLFLYSQIYLGNKHDVFKKLTPGFKSSAKNIFIYLKASKEIFFLVPREHKKCKQCLPCKLEW